MFKTKRNLLLIILSLFSIFSFHVSSSIVRAKEQTKTVVVGKDIFFEGDQFKAAESLIFSGTVDGDLFLAGGNVIFEGETTGDLFVVAGKGVINGKVGQSLRLAGGQMSVNSSIGRNLLAVGGTIDISKETKISGSQVVLAGIVNDNGQTILGANILADSIYLNAKFGKNVNLIARKELLIGPETNIKADLSYKAPEELKIEKGKQVTGEISYAVLPKEFFKWDKAKPLSDISAFNNLKKAFKIITLPIKISWLVFSFLLGFLIIKLFPKASFQIVKILETKPLSSFGWGLLFWLSLPLLAVLLVLSLVGIFLLPLFASLVVLVIILAKIFGSFAVGHLLFKELLKTERRGWALLVGLIVSLFMGFISIISWIYSLLLYTTAVGAILVVTIKSIKKTSLRG